MSIESLPRSAAAPSVQALILATEQMVARHGVWGASLRQINEAAGVRNASAVQYHFGSREALFTAVYERRIPEVDACRLAELAKLEREGRQDDLRALVAATVYGLAAQLTPRAEGNYYIRFLERCVREFGDNPPNDLAHANREGLIRAEAHMARLLAYLPEPVVQIRLNQGRGQALNALAAIEGELEREPDARAAAALQIEILIDGIAAMLQAPLSPRTMRALEGDAKLGRS
jgi:AcrR family transcriptional regulator